MPSPTTAESDLGTEISALLTKNHFKVSDLGLLLEGAVPDDCEVLILNQPTRDLAKDELKFIQTYLSKGGQVSLVLPGEDFDHPNLDALMKEYGLQLAGRLRRGHPALLHQRPELPDLLPGAEHGQATPPPA